MNRFSSEMNSSARVASSSGENLASSRTFSTRAVASHSALPQQSYPLLPPPVYEPTVGFEPTT